ncbi:nuclear transport factor 2 family protein [Pedobacter alpinus]|uniref:Nuclear transport factor 2 family protein n=1 Tax=Pedobacter alpinus TaxID=1590643 RepID=A0ABW5TP98_9SPHI
MKGKSLITLFIVFAAFNIKAQTKKEKVEIAAKYFVDALISGRQADLEYITCDSLSYGHSSGRIETKKDFVYNLVTNQSDFVTIDIIKQTVKIEGDVAIVRHNLHATTNDKGNPGEVYLGVMLIFKEQPNGEWKLLARQAYKV